MEWARSNVMSYKFGKSLVEVHERSQSPNNPSTYPRGARMNNVIIARGIAVLGAPALMLTLSAAPAWAGVQDGDQGKPDKVSVTVCKEVVKKDKDKSDEDRDKQKFGFEVETDKAKKSFRLKDGQCKYLKLKFDDPKVRVSEDSARGYKVKDIYVSGDVKKTSTDDNKVRIKFKDKDEPQLWVKFVNKKDEKHH